jgi:hypothetical protein
MPGFWQYCKKNNIAELYTTCSSGCTVQYSILSHKWPHRPQFEPKALKQHVIRSAPRSATLSFISQPQQAWTKIWYSTLTVFVRYGTVLYNTYSTVLLCLFPKKIVPVVLHTVQ